VVVAATCRGDGGTSDADHHHSARRGDAHRTRAVFDRYNILSEDDLAAADKRTLAYVEEQQEAPATVVPLSARRAHSQHGQSDVGAGAWLDPRPAGLGFRQFGANVPGAEGRGSACGRRWRSTEHALPADAHELNVDLDAVATRMALEDA
jgi:hypothetical protein